MRVPSTGAGRWIVVVGAAALLAVPASPAIAAPGPVIPAPTGPDRSVVSTADQLSRPPGVTDEALTFMDKQASLDRVAQAVRTTAAKVPDSGLSGTILDTEHSTIRLYWHGAMPQTVSEQIAAARGNGVAVVVAQAPFTEAELLAETARMSKRPLFAGAQTGPRALQVAPQPDGSGISVAVSGLPAGTTAAQARQLVPALDSAYPLTFSAMSPPAFTARYFDQSPYWGGSYIHNNATGYNCSDAYGVTGLNGAATYLFTAAHCGTGAWSSGVVRFPDGTEVQTTYGSTFPAGRRTDLDVELLLVSGAGASAGNGVYYGPSINPPNNDPGSSTGIAVGGTINNVVGARLCTSGSYSGTICNIEIQLTNLTVTYALLNGVSRVTNLVLAYKLLDDSGITAAVGEGDSGGPAFSVVSGKAQARGVISGMRTGDFVRPCTGWVFAGRTCSVAVYYADLTNAMNAVGVRLNTG